MHGKDLLSDLWRMELVDLICKESLWGKCSWDGPWYYLYRWTQFQISLIRRICLHGDGHRMAGTHLHQPTRLCYLGRRWSRDIWLFGIALHRLMLNFLPIYGCITGMCGTACMVCSLDRIHYIVPGMHEQKMASAPCFMGVIKGCVQSCCWLWKLWRKMRCGWIVLGRWCNS